MIHSKNNQSNLYTFFEFDASTDFKTFPEALLTTTRKTNFDYHYSCKCRRGYSLSSDPFNTWKKQEAPADYSRKDIMRAYKLGRA